MAEFVFTSPGVKFKERDLTYVTRNVGVTTLGLVGETLKGPAFDPFYIQDKTQFLTRFGGQSIQRFPDNGSLIYQLPYVANAYLEETNQLWVTRVLGLSGYDAGTAWMITLDAGVDPSTTGSTAGSPFTATYTNNIYLGKPLYNINDTGYTFTGYTKVPPSSFVGTGYSFIVTSTTGTSGTVTVTPHTHTGSSYTEYEKMVLAVIRSRATVRDYVNAVPVTTFKATNLSITDNLSLVAPGDMFRRFNLVAADTGSTETYTVSLNPNDTSYLPNVIGSTPKDKNTKIWVQSIYPDLIKKLDAEGIGYGINTVLISATSSNYTDWNVKFQTPETPWVVSQLMGSQVSRLFKFISISDGDAANQEIKISIANINPITNEFDVYIRDFYDTDASPNVLESYTRCTLIKGLNSYIAQKIGTSDGEYPLLSNYVMIELDSSIPDNTFPAGFEGYMFNDYAMSATSDPSTTGVAPKIFYKTSYSDAELGKLQKYYLGISEHGYDTSNSTGTGINQNFFNYNGDTSSAHVKSKGFHMDCGATDTYYDGTTYIGQFEVGNAQFQTYNDIEDETNPYFDIKSRKFTLVPAGGFDGWNVHRTKRSNGDGYQQAGIYSGLPGQPTIYPHNDFQAWQTAIDTFSNPESVTINLFATPGIDWMNNSVLVRDTINMIEEQRADSLYVIDSPDVPIDISVGDGGKADVMASQQVADALTDTGIDSSYSCTYFPWIQIKDTQNNVNVYIPPTGEVVRAMAYTDNSTFPWFVPAGLNRGVTNARKSKYKLSIEARDILYRAKINPMADFAEAGTAIFGQKTLQVKESALDRINVRRLLLQIKVLIANIAIRLVFEQNDQATIDQFLSKANPILESIKRERGLTDFRVKMDDINNTPETRDRNELYGEISLKPTRAVEYIGIKFTITPSGASFADVGA